MSQRGAATDPAASRPSDSPEASRRQHGPLLDESHGGPEPADPPSGATSGTSRGLGRAPTRALAVRNILNPPEPSVLDTLRPYGMSQPLQASHARAASHGETGLSWSLRRQHDAGQTLSPRLASRWHGAVHEYPRDAHMLPQSSAFYPSPGKSSYPGEYPQQVSEEIFGLQRSRRTQGGHGAVDRQARSFDRSFEQAVSQHQTETPYSSSLGPSRLGRSQSLHVSAPQQPGAMLSRSLSTATKGPGQAQSSWSDAMRQSVSRTSLSGQEGQQAFIALPGSPTPIPVQVDYSQASQKANEKRKRNASASTRHRKKKKTMQEDNMRELQKLKEQQQQVAREMEHLKRQRDFYRDDRNRLRDVVARTAGIHQHAAGPPSPLASEMEPWADRSPEATAGHVSEVTPTRDYASDVAAEEQSHETGPSHRSDMANSFGSAGRVSGAQLRPQSSASSTTGGDRLRPLLAMNATQAAHGVGTSRQTQQQQQQWLPAPPQHFGPPWAAGPPPRPHEGGSQGHWQEDSHWQ